MRCSRRGQETQALHISLEHSYFHTFTYIPGWCHRGGGKRIVCSVKSNVLSLHRRFYRPHTKAFPRDTPFSSSAFLRLCNSGWWELVNLTQLLLLTWNISGSTCELTVWRSPIERRDKVLRMSKMLSSMLPTLRIHLHPPRL